MPASARAFAPTSEQARLIERATEVVSSDERIQAAGLTGSFAAGTADESVIEFDRRVAAELIRRGRALAEATKAEWPAALEEATVSYLRRSLGAEFGA